MRQVWIPRIGGSPKCSSSAKLPTPEPGPGQVRIRVARGGGQTSRTFLSPRIGALIPTRPPLPTVVGYEVSGAGRQARAPGVAGPAIGTRRRHAPPLRRVLGHGHRGPPTSRSRSRMTSPSRRPRRIPVTYLTAWIMLVHLGNVRRGDRVPRPRRRGAESGRPAVQICRWRGAEVLGTARPVQARRALREQGSRSLHRLHDAGTSRAEVEEDHETGRGVEIALRMRSAEPSFSKSYRCLAPLGRLYVFGVSSFATGGRGGASSAPSRGSGRCRPSSRSRS